MDDPRLRRLTEITSAALPPGQQRHRTARKAIFLAVAMITQLHLTPI
jgi:hypothetical protein